MSTETLTAEEREDRFNYPGSQESFEAWAKALRIIDALLAENERLERELEEAGWGGPVNINDLVRVELTDRGRSVLAAYIVDDRVSAREWSGEWQMWRLMRVFGSHHCAGLEPLFVRNQIVEVEVSL